MSRYKVLNSGRTIEGLPAPAILEDEAIPAPVADAVASWREAVEALHEATSALRAAEKEAQESTLRVRGERTRWLAEVREKTKSERRALQAAERRSSAAANGLVGALEEHGGTLRAIGARLALQAHAVAVDAAVDLDEARARFRVAPKVGTHPLVDDELVSRGRIGQRQEGPLVDLDRVDVAALAEIAGEEPGPFGFVERVSRRHAASLWTTARRAARLGSALGANDWTTRENLEGVK
ncbi:hypothetical protein GCM10009737_10050 [Nocardioides lentus]|uniref:DUF222 domain-containing protein n=1 Tax=Nocardioides lentus TaxID=338077 RepID=A0ABN2P3M0_9ACTN